MNYRASSARGGRRPPARGSAGGVRSAWHGRFGVAAVLVVALTAVVALITGLRVSSHSAEAAAVGVPPWRIGKIVAAALVLLHVDYARTT